MLLRRRGAFYVTDEPSYLDNVTAMVDGGIEWAIMVSVLCEEATSLSIWGGQLGIWFLLVNMGSVL